MARTLPAIGVALAMLAAPLARPARAQPGPGEAGTERESPAAAEEELGPPQVEPSDEGRFPLRGSPAPHPAPNPTKESLRQFEREAFGSPPPPAPANDEDLGVTAAAARAETPRPPRPEELRPDLPWLKDLKTDDIDVPLRWNARVIQFLQFYRDDPRGHAIMAGWIRAEGRYRDLILEALRRHHLPADLLYIAMIESSFDPLDLSRVGASGLWQFMPEGGRIYGLRQDYWLDERNDPEKANEAQMYYFRDLIDRFGNWHLALAAFNCGYGAVLKSLAKYGTNDFWALLDIESGLPWESSVYVPKFLAAVVIAHNRAAFGFGDVTMDAPWSYDRVTVSRSVDLGTIARAAGVDVKAIKALNPQLRRGRTPPDAEYTLRVPRGARERFAQTFPQLARELEGTDTYVLRHGERFEDVARTYGISTGRLRDMNGVRDLAEVRGGTMLVVPRIDASARAQNAALAENDLYHSDVVPGGPDEPLLVPVKDKDFVVDGKKRVFYRVVAGDTLEEIAGVLGVTTDELCTWNGLDPDTRVQLRMVLEAFVPPGFDAAQHNVALLDDARLLIVTSGSPEHLDIYEGRKGRVREVVTVKAGDTLDSIGHRYVLTKYDVARINHRSYQTPLEPGEELVVYKVVDRAKAKAAGVFKKPPKEIAARRSHKSKGKHDGASVSSGSSRGHDGASSGGGHDGASSGAKHDSDKRAKKH
jgi:membrane-bound lytic murein transglycosylase D